MIGIVPALIALLIASTAVGHRVSPLAQNPSHAKDCVEFTSRGRLRPGTPFQYALPRGLEFRMTPEGNPSYTQWSFSVVPREGQKVDFLWIVSPPWQTAPQRAIGVTYGQTLRESMEIERSLRFVLSADDYAEALAVYDAATRLGQTDGVLDRLAALGKGTLDFKVTGYEGRKKTDGTDSDLLNWVMFKAVACVPRQ